RDLERAPRPLAAAARARERLWPDAGGELHPEALAAAERLRLLPRPDPLQLLPVRHRLRDPRHEHPAALDVPARQRSLPRLEPELGAPDRQPELRPRPREGRGDAQGALRLARLSPRRRGAAPPTSVLSNGDYQDSFEGGTILF